ncbi:methionyl-tRNA formyltransferase [Psychromonas aquimarina]|uniref:methionyl-tRNA formyltransferase n=1 Tax=Psychromonas aquimarina TaxID=444919 RepID=UPI000418BF30|nr:formyltransferase family protein [Psychromonas aquimarina]
MDVIILYSAGHLGSAVIMNKLFNMPEINIVGVVKAQPLKMSIRGRTRIINHLKKVGWKFAWLLLWQRGIQVLGYLVTLAFPFLRKRLKPAWKIAADHNIPVFHCGNINDKSCQEFIKKLQPDLLISAYFSQILKKEIISLPKTGVLNIHPGWLPSYKGAMAYFWVLNNGSDRGGVTVHWIDEGIDTGEVLARKAFTLKANATQESVLMYTAVIGAKLLGRVLRKLIDGKDPKLHTAHSQDEKEMYYPMPGDKDFESYFKQRRYFRIRDVLSVLVMKKY